MAAEAYVWYASPMAHIHEKVDFTVDVFIVHNNRVLLRKHDKYDLWLGVGGHIDLGEDPNEAAVREVKEEVGLDVVLWDGNRRFQYDGGNKQLIPPIALNRHRINETHEHVSMIYIGTSDTDDVQIMYEGDRSDDWRWLTAAEVDSFDLGPDVRFYATEALRVLGTV